MFPPVETFTSGMLTVTDGDSIYWECSGNPAGKPVLYLHGGPGGGMRAGYRRWFHPDRHLIVGFEQRGCGRSRPLVTEDLSTLASNTTQNLINDIEALREHLEVDRWLLAGVSWGTTLALAYAQTHPERVSEMVLLATTLTDASAVEWITETVGCLFPVEWDEFRAAAQPRQGQRLVDAYYELVTNPDPVVRERAAIAWDRWENAHISLDPHEPGPRSTDQTHRQVFFTLVTHYWKHAAFLQEGALLDGMTRLQDIPGVLIQGKLDVSGPASMAWRLHKLWPSSRFVLVNDEGHGGPKMVEALVDAVADFLVPMV
ncbi:MAG: prolyl aminopeptidase [Sciscionella sp.]